MSDIAALTGVSKRYGRGTALEGIDLALTENVVHGLLGRNGAGKSTLLGLLGGRTLPTSGRVEVFGRSPFENAQVQSRLCFVREGQVYPEAMRVRQVLGAARLFHPNWDAAFAQQLCEAFELATDRRVDKLSRGQHSAVGVVLGLASRAPLTLFDEPYLGMDAVARQRFYDRLLADVAEFPRTVVLSTHLIDEVADLLERVVLIDRGRVRLDADVEALRQEAVTVTGPSASVDAAVAGRDVLHTERLGDLARVTVRSAGRPLRLGPELRVEPVSLQRLMVHLADTAEAQAAPAERVPSTDGASR